MATKREFWWRWLPPRILASAPNWRNIVPCGKGKGYAFDCAWSFFWYRVSIALHLTLSSIHSVSLYVHNPFCFTIVFPYILITLVTLSYYLYLCQTRFGWSLSLSFSGLWWISVRILPPPLRRRLRIRRGFDQRRKMPNSSCRTKEDCVHTWQVSIDQPFILRYCCQRNYGILKADMLSISSFGDSSNHFFDHFGKPSSFALPIQCLYVILFAFLRGRAVHQFIPPASHKEAGSYLRVFRANRLQPT